MTDDDLVERLADEPDERTVAALPDGSVDVYYAVCDAEGEPIENRETLADRLTDDEPSFPVERESTEPDGRGVVLATKVDGFSLPQKADRGDQHADVVASPERPAYVVALEKGSPDAPPDRRGTPAGIHAGVEIASSRTIRTI